MALALKKYNTLKISEKIAVISQIVFLTWSFPTIEEEEEKSVHYFVH